jgi:putative ABC transport system permease protein
MLRQIRAVTWMNLSSIPQRFGTSSVIIVGIAGVVAVLISVLAMATGFQRTIVATGRDDRAIVLRGGSESELASTLSREATLTIMDAPGIRKDAAGKALASAEAVVIVDMPKKSNDSGANVTIRGIGAAGLALRPEIHLIAGRMFQRGLRELIVGSGAQAQFKGLDVGSHLALRGSDWTIVGAFESNGDSHESELLADGETVLSAYRRNLYQSVVVLLESKDSFAAFKSSLTTNPAVGGCHARARLLRTPVAAHEHRTVIHCLRRGRHHGGRSAVWRPEYHVFGGQRALARDRDAARDRLWRERGGAVGSD